MSTTYSSSSRIPVFMSRFLKLESLLLKSRVLEYFRTLLNTQLHSECAKTQSWLKLLRDNFIFITIVIYNFSYFYNNFTMRVVGISNLVVGW